MGHSSDPKRCRYSSCAVAAPGFDKLTSAALANGVIVTALTWLLLTQVGHCQPFNTLYMNMYKYIAWPVTA